MLNLIINFFRKPYYHESQMTRLVNMRVASTSDMGTETCDCDDQQVHATLTKLKIELAAARKLETEKYGRQFWSNTGETFKPVAEREAPEAVKESVLQAVKTKDSVPGDPLAQAESAWDAWNTGEHAAYSDEHWINSYSKTREEIEAFRAELDLEESA